MARKTTATAAPRYVPNPRYENAPYEVVYIVVAGHVAKHPVAYRYYDYDASLRHVVSGVPQPESVPPMVKECE